VHKVITYYLNRFNMDIHKAQITYCKDIFLQIYSKSSSKDVGLWHICEYCSLPYCSTTVGFVKCSDCQKFSCGGGEHCPTGCKNKGCVINK
jgi:hypothetical protein